MTRTLKKLLSDSLLVNKVDWETMLKPALNKYNSKMVHSTTGLVSNDAHKDENLTTVTGIQQ